MHAAENQSFPDFIKAKLSSKNTPKLIIGTVNNTSLEKIFQLNIAVLMIICLVHLILRY